MDSREARAGCQSAVAGSPAGNIFAHAILRWCWFPVSARRRDLQASGLCSPEQNSRRDAHTNRVKPCRAGERAATFVPFLDVALAIRGANYESVITRRGGRPVRFPE